MTKIGQNNPFFFTVYKYVHHTRVHKHEMKPARIDRSTWSDKFVYRVATDSAPYLITGIICLSEQE